MALESSAGLPGLIRRRADLLTFLLLAALVLAMAFLAFGSISRNRSAWKARRAQDKPAIHQPHRPPPTSGNSGGGGDDYRPRPGH